MLPTLLAGVHSLALTHAFAPGLLTTPTSTAKRFAPTPVAIIQNGKKEPSTSLWVSVGLGPEEKKEPVDQKPEEEEEKPPLVEPDHELFRDSRLTDFDRQCDSWFASLLGNGSDDELSFLGKVSEEASRRIHTLNKLERNVSHDFLYRIIILKK